MSKRPQAALATRFKDMPLIPTQSAGATDGSFLRAAGIPVYGFSGLWGYRREPEPRRMASTSACYADGFHGQVPIMIEMLRRVAG